MTHAQSAGHTDVGRIRTNNEDAFVNNPEAGLFVVCDGMGGHNAGEVASLLACDIISANQTRLETARTKALETQHPKDIRRLEKLLGDAVQQAGEAIFAQAEALPDQMGMGTTCTAVYLIGHTKAAVAHVGDSRLWLLRNNAIHQITDDHTYVQDLVKRGAISSDEALHHPQQNILARALGVQPTVRVDTTVIDLDPGDTLLLASDGLHGYFPDANIMIPVLSNEDLDLAIKTLILGAKNAGGHDNITAIAIRISEEAPTAHASAVQCIKTLQDVPLFAFLDYRELTRVLGLMRNIRVKAKETFIKQGTLGTELFVIVSGEVEILRGTKRIALLGPGHHVGEMALADDSPRSATARAVTETLLLGLDRVEFLQLLVEEPKLSCKLLFSFVQALSRRLRQSTDALYGVGEQN